ncbi:MAG: TIGR00153 family protein [Desulfobacterales bacterium]|nr:TIGR00153 family protein [Desulfobacterales bacterium]
MGIISNLFSRSPFSPLQAHMERVASCVKKIEELFNAYVLKDYDLMARLAEEISNLEQEADLTKNDIRNSVPKGIFLAINRSDLLEILSLQDTIADKAEDIGILMTLKKLEPLKDLQEDIKIFLAKNLEAVYHVHGIIREMDELLETSFGGKEAKKVMRMVEKVAFLEHEADVIQHELMKKLYNADDVLSYRSFILWMNILQTIASLSNTSEKLANRVRMLLEIK